MLEADLEIVVDPGIPVPSDKIRLVETFVLTTRHFVVNLIFVTNHAILL